MDYKTSGQMFDNAKQLVDSYKLDNRRLTLRERLSAEHRVKDNEVLEQLSIAITGLSMLMSEYDRIRLVEMLQNEGMANKLIDAMSRVKLEALPMGC